MSGNWEILVDYPRERVNQGRWIGDSGMRTVMVKRERERELKLKGVKEKDYFDETCFR